MEVDEGEWKWIKVNEGERNGMEWNSFFLIFQILLITLPTKSTN